LVPRLTVLVVDPSEETGEVLRTALGQGANVVNAKRADQGLDLARRHQPALIVVDEDCDRAWPENLARQYDNESQLHRTPLVVLGTARRRAVLPSGEFVSKPYHYAPLIRRIEELLERARQPLVRSA
jgi:DNA-binding response OmpR family regulator